MRNLLLVGMMLLAAGCASTSKVITRHQVSLEEIKKVCWRSTDHVSGCATVTTTECNIYVPTKAEYAKLRELYPKLKEVHDDVIEQFILGHETKHCFDGDFHGKELK